MEIVFSRLKDFLYERRNSDIFDSTGKLYKEIVSVQKEGEASSFYYPAQLEFLYRVAYRCHKAQGLQSIVNISLPFDIASNISFSDFCLEMEKYQKEACPSEVVPDDTLHNRIIRGVNRSLKKPTNDGWAFLEKDKIEGSVSEESLDRKIYLSVDNKDLHSFASLLLDKCDNFGIQYQFKINADDTCRRADNVVIYTSDKDFLNYISAIKDIKQECPYIDFGQAHLLAYPYNDYIGVASIESDDSIISYSQNLCEEICRLRAEEEISFDHFFQNVQSVMVEKMNDTITFCEKSSMMEDFVTNKSVNSNLTK